MPLLIEVSRTLLEQYVALVIEATRSTQGGPFNINSFKQLKSAVDMRKYAEERLVGLGTGTSREAFLLNSRHVLKIARTRTEYGGSHVGQGQNRTEATISKDPECGHLIAQVKASDPEHKWVVAELVRSITEAEFKRLTGESFSDFRHQVRDVIKKVPFGKEPSELVQQVVAMVTKYNLDYGDLIVIGHWGKTASGRAVILDYGYNDEVDHMYAAIT